MGKWFRTSQGEVYGKCGLTFGATPTEVTDDVLKTKRGDLGLTIGERLAADERLIECPAPKSQAAPDGGPEGGGDGDDKTGGKNPAGKSSDKSAKGDKNAK